VAEPYPQPLLEIDTPQFKANGLLVLWWDEDGSDDNTCPPGVSPSGKDLCGGKTVVVLYGPGVVRAGFSSGTYYMQQSIERMLFGVLGLDPNDAGVSSSSLVSMTPPNTFS